MAKKKKKSYPKGKSSSHYPNKQANEKQKSFKDYKSAGEAMYKACGITMPVEQRKKHSGKHKDKDTFTHSIKPRISTNQKDNRNKSGNARAQKTEKTQNAITNAGHYYYVKGKGERRDFGQKLPDYALPDLIGQQSINESLAYIKDYFKIIQPEKDAAQAVAGSGSPLDQKSKIRNCKFSFELTTTYPGLLTGVGYMHPIAEPNDDDFQSGFYFDWSTGIPVIPGSTVKGVLRSVFPGKKKNKKDEEIRKGKIAYLIGCMDKKLVDQDSTHNFITSLESKIFENKGDIFYDAYISCIPDNGKIFAEDYITPHPGPFSNPTPLRFLKIAPSVTFKFQFKLKDSEIDEGIIVTSQHKKELFKKILLDFGIGAKRNTGYGVLI